MKPSLAALIVMMLGLPIWTGAEPSVSVARSTSTTTPVNLPAPMGFKAERQDANAVRLMWASSRNDVGYTLYASYDSDRPDFHKENETPIKANFLVWDAPRKGPRAFVFYLTAIDKNGNESVPSSRVRFGWEK
jgi:hypothetical protein